VKHSDRYSSYYQLSRHEIEGRDYRRVTRKVTQSSVAIIAPHGGGIEPRTSGISRAIAGEEFNLYLFEGIKRKGNKHLHVTSRNFDDPLCLELISGCDKVIAIHGCKAVGEQVLLGGLDGELKQRFALAFIDAGLSVASDGHKFPAVNPDNICNRGRSGRGVQVEISGRLRRGSNIYILIEAMRDVLSQHTAQRPWPSLARWY
jgi:phage replication-related protein YjqB (UPF0714/DUF867 family)